MKAADEARAARLSRRLARGLVADLVTGTRRAAAESGVVTALRSRQGIVPGGRRKPSPSELRKRARYTFVAVPLTREELATLRDAPRPRGMAWTNWLRARLGLPEGQW